MHAALERLQHHRGVRIVGRRHEDGVHLQLLRQLLEGPDGDRDVEALGDGAGLIQVRIHDGGDPDARQPLEDRQVDDLGHTAGSDDGDAHISGHFESLPALVGQYV